VVPNIPGGRAEKHPLLSLRQGLRTEVRHNGSKAFPLLGMEAWKATGFQLTQSGAGRRR